jgi:ElaB/YqjD/DUF883 family membrane-anchored ribosome-binding protein
MNQTTHLANPASHELDGMAGLAATKADDALSATRRAADGALDTLKDGVNPLRSDTPGALSRAAAQVEELTRRTIERAQQAGTDVRLTVDRTGERTVAYIKDEPVKSVLMAAAAGAAVATLIALLSSSRSRPR